MRHFATALLAVGIMAAAVPAARAADTTFPPNPLANSTIHGNLTVPSGPDCDLISVTVTGNVQVQTNAALNITGLSTIVGNVSVGTEASLITPVGHLTIDGNFDANQCNSLILPGGDTVGGNVQIQYCAEASVGTNEIGGNLACNNSNACEVFSNRVKGNVEVNDNGSAEVENNAIGDNLQCQGNTSITVSGNKVGGHTEGQCAP